MSNPIQSHLHLLARFTSLGAPASYIDQAIERVVEAHGAAGSEREARAAALRALLEEYKSKKGPLMAEGQPLARAALPPDKFSLTNDLCYLTRRAEREGWPIRDEASFELLLALVVRCEELDAWLQASLERLFEEGAA